MKNSYFFHISLNIGRSDMKQTPKNSVRSMLSYPFTLVWDSHTYFFLCYIFDVTIVLAGLDYSLNRSDPPIHQGPYTKVHTPRSIHQATFKGSNVHTPAYFYIEKNSKCPLFWYDLYKKKPLRALKHTIHLHTSCTPNSVLKFRAQTLCSDSVLKFCATCAIILIILIIFQTAG